MQLKLPKNTEKYFWTKHAIYKLRQYGLSAQRVIRVINNPQRKEEGIVPRTVAVMQPASVRNKNGKKIWSQEIWAMYKISSKQKVASDKRDSRTIENKKPHTTSYLLPATQIKIISAWRYPGVSPKKDPIPEEILREISEL